LGGALTFETIRPGIPTTVELGGTSVTTTELAPTVVLSPIFIFPKIFAPAPITTLFPIVGCLFSFMVHRYFYPGLSDCAIAKMVYFYSFLFAGYSDP